MHAQPTAPGSASPNSEGDRVSLRQESLRTLIQAILVVGVGWGVALRVRFDGGWVPPWHDWIPFYGLILTAGATAWVRQRRAELAGVLLPVLLLATLLLYLAQAPAGSLAPLYVVPIIALSSLTCSRLWMMTVGLGGFAALFALGGWRHGAMPPPYQATLIVGGLTAGVSWLATHNLYTAVEWAIYSHRQAMQSVQALRERRGELRHLSDMLSHNQDRLHYLNLRLEQTKVAAEEAYRTKQHFVANVSHELRTPLNLIAGFSEMMALSPESYGGVRLPPEYQEDVMEVYRSSKHLLGLVEDVLALAQLEAGQMIVHHEWSDLATVVWEAVETVRPLYEAKGLTLEASVADGLPDAYIDAGRIRQVLLNLLSNAQRFTERGGVTVTLCPASEEVLLEVADTGIGIAAEDLPHVFEEFHSLTRGPSTQQGGFGLGLSISRRLIEAHGGRLWATSEVGRGSCFRIALPLDAAAGRPTLVHTAPCGATEDTKPVILAVGEEESGCGLERCLEAYRVVPVRLGQVPSACEQYVPAALWLTDGDGAATDDLDGVTRAAPNLPVIECKVPSRDEVARKLKADGFLPKPITREQLGKLLRQLSRQRPIHKILVVDDDPHMVRMLHRTLDSLHRPAYQVVEACGGQEGLELLAAEQPDLLLLDLAMPEVSGYDVLRAARSAPHAVNTRVVLMSGVEIDQETLPVYSIAVRRQAGISLPQSLRLVNLLVKELASTVSGPQ